MANKCEAIILSVGKTWEPIVYTLKHFQPKVAVFLCTPESCQTLDKVLSEYQLPPSCYQISQVPDDPQAIGQMVMKCYSAYVWLREEKKLEPSAILVDPTAGRKWMSSAVTMIASYLGANMGYVDVAFKDGKPDPSTMKIVDLGNAYDQTGFLEIERGIQFFNAGVWENAKLTFQRIQSHHSSLNDLAIGLTKLSDVMERWDLFVHYKENLSQDLKDVVKILRRVSFTDQSYSEIIKILVSDIERLKAISDRIFKEVRPNLLMTVDLFLNAQRCIKKGRYDDGVARLYRTLESLAQFYLKKDYGIDTTKADLKGKNFDFIDKFREYKRGHLPENLALEDAYLLLYFAKHHLGKAVIQGFSEREKRPKNIFHELLEKRNNSIMAHGFEPIGQEIAQKLFKKMDQLLARSMGEEFIKLRDELIFPQIPSIFRRSSGTWKGDL